LPGAFVTRMGDLNHCLDVSVTAITSLLQPHFGEPCGALCGWKDVARRQSGCVADAVFHFLSIQAGTATLE
jgi:hypothetical protein